MNLILFSGKRETYRLSRGDHRFNHIKAILRSSPGDVVRVGVVNGPTGRARVTTIEREEILLEATWSDEPGSAARASGPPVTVILGHPRPPVLKRLWRDLASLGVASIRVFSGELGERSYLTSSAWNDPGQWLREGLSQGGHTALPRLDRFSGLAEAIRAESCDEREEPARFFGCLSGAGTLSIRGMVERIPAAPSVHLCIGPERGLTEREEALLRAARFFPVTLGPHILRTEVAAILLAGNACGAFVPA
ncbi:MAG: RsmE family RNA methyltransferase [Spirochaetaceae bacterium]|nr:MAG: RsmE family RNA methyltransferase [Spirochaetaceae bacterium]